MAFTFCTSYLALETNYTLCGSLMPRREESWATWYQRNFFKSARFPTMDLCKISRNQILAPSTNPPDYFPSTLFERFLEALRLNSVQNRTSWLSNRTFLTSCFVDSTHSPRCWRSPSFFTNPWSGISQLTCVRCDWFRILLKPVLNPCLSFPSFPSSFRSTSNV